MSLSATELYERLIEQSENRRRDFVLADEVTESEVKTWLSSQDVEGLRAEYDAEITRRTVPALDEIAKGTFTLRDIIKSRGDDPSDFESGYAIRADRTVIQYFQPWVSGKRPMTEAEADSLREEHVGKMVERAVNSELLDRAKTEFGV